MKYEVFNVDLNFYHQDLHVFIPVVGALVSFSIFWFLWQSDRLKNRLIRIYGSDLGSARLIIITKIVGGIIMFLLPALTYLAVFPETTLAEFGWVLPGKTRLATFMWILVLGSLSILIIGRNARSSENLRFYPQIRARQWTRSMLYWNLAGWTVYLIGYEALFRGVLLFPLVKHLGFWTAIAINIGLYAGTHIPKGLKETVSSIPLGIIFCILTVKVGNIWIAVSVHVAMAWTNELISFKYHPDMVLE